MIPRLTFSHDGIVASITMGPRDQPSSLLCSTEIPKYQTTNHDPASSSQSTTANNNNKKKKNVSGPFNLLTTESLSSLMHEFTNAAHNPTTRLVVLASDVPGMFSLGLDPAFVVTQDMAGRITLFETLLQLYRTMLSLPIPTVAAVDVCQWQLESCSQ
jgi:hypothetical protein